jgi:hypothetical protein
MPGCAAAGGLEGIGRAACAVGVVGAGGRAIGVAAAATVSVGGSRGRAAAGLRGLGGGMARRAAMLRGGVLRGTGLRIVGRPAATAIRVPGAVRPAAAIPAPRFAGRVAFAPRDLPAVCELILDLSVDRVDVFLIFNCLPRVFDVGFARFDGDFRFAGFFPPRVFFLPAIVPSDALSRRCRLHLRVQCSYWTGYVQYF